MRTRSRSPRLTPTRRRGWRRTHDDRGATAILGVVMMLVLVAFVGFAVDVGLVVNERHQEQSAVDTATLSGARAALLEGGTDQQIFDEVTRLSHQNMDNPPPLAEWRTAFEQCTDAERVAAGFTQPLALPGVSVDCISFDASRSELRVRLPTTQMDTTFASVLGFDTWSVSAFAEAGLAEGVGTPNILPFALSNSSSGSGTTCLKTPPNGQAEADCDDGSTAGNFGYLALPRPTDPTNQACNGGYRNIVMNNIAQGADHELSVRTSNDGGVTFTNTQVDDLCPRIGLGLKPNHVFVETGVTNAYLAQGMVEGSSNITDGQGARLTRGPWEKTLAPQGYAIDDRPLWEFFDVGLSGGGAVSYDGVIAPDHAPVICDPAFIGATPATAQVYRARIDACFLAYDTPVSGLTYTADLFQRDANANGLNDILETPRFSWLPEAWQVLEGSLCNGNNCDYDIQQFRPVFIQDLYYTQGNKYWVVPPGPGDLTYGTNTTVPSQAGLRGVNAFVFNYELFPQDVLDKGPLAGRFELVEIALTR